MSEEQISLEKYTKTTLEEKGIFLKKSLGQNFLINQNIIDRIIEVSEVNEDDIVLEIGPGIGALTRSLVKVARHVIAVEVDERFIDILRVELADFNNITIIHEDILKLNIDDLIKETITKIKYEDNFKNKEKDKFKKDEINTKKEKYNIKVVANLPYYISTPVLTKLIDSKSIEKIYIMLQKELAERFLSQTGKRESGGITYFISYYMETKKELNVSKNNFKPVPKVDSQIISLKRRNYHKLVKDEELLFKLIQIGFMQRRKTYLNNIKSYINNNKSSKKYINKQKEIAYSKKNIKDEVQFQYNITIEKMNDIFTKLNIPYTARAEEITLDQYIDIVNLY